MKYFVKTLALILCLVMISTIAAGCKVTTSSQENSNLDQGINSKQEEKSYFNKTGFPIVNEPITLTAYTRKSGNTDEFKNLMLWQEYEKMTGIHVEWNHYTGNANEARNIVIASGELPDMFFKDNFPTSELMSLGSQGILISLNDLIDEYGPSIKERFNQFPDVKKGLTMPDGNIYSLPYMDDAVSTRIQTKMFVNKPWLDALQLSMPTTTEEFYNVLKAFKDKDPGGVGEDKIVPLSAPFGIKGMLWLFAGSFGLMNRGLSNPNFDIDETTGKLRFIPIQPEYKELLIYLNRLYKEELLDSEIFTITSTQFAAKCEEGIIGAGNGPSNILFGKDSQDNYYGLPEVLKGPQGHQIMSIQGSSLRTPGNFTITNENKYPEATMRWIEYFYGEEGVKMFFMGFEGITYKVVDGKCEYLDSLHNDPQGLTFDQALGRYVCWAGGSNPSVVTEEYFKGGENQPRTLEAAKTLKKFMLDEVWPAFVFTKEESASLSGLNSDIQTYLDEMMAQFIIGKTPITEWDNYVSQLEKMGLDEYIKINEQAYERYKK